MRNTDTDTERPVPIFLIADDDGQSIAEMVERLPPEWFYIPVRDARHLIKYAREFETTAIFLADSFADPPRGGVPRLLQELLDQVGKPVVILAEMWDPQTATRWQRMGAFGCIPHPTRRRERLIRMRDTCNEIALAALRQ